MYDEDVVMWILEKVMMGWTFSRIFDLAAVPEENIGHPAVGKMLPSHSTFYGWLIKNDPEDKRWDELRGMYCTAMQLRADTVVHEAQDIADNVAEITEHLQKAKLRVGVRQWQAERMNPARYGMKNRLALSGALDSDAPIEVQNWLALVRSAQTLELAPEVLQLLYHGWRLGQFTRDLEPIGLE